MNKLKKESGNREIIEKGIVGSLYWDVAMGIEKIICLLDIFKDGANKICWLNGCTVCGEVKASINSEGFSLGSWKNGAAVI